MSTNTDVVVRLKVAELKSNHPALEAATQEFVSDARKTRHVNVVERDVDSPGGKGFLQEFALIPSGPSAAWAVVTLVKLWLGRDRRRSVQITIKNPGQDPVIVEATGDSISLQTFEKVIYETLGRETR